MKIHELVPKFREDDIPFEKKVRIVRGYLRSSYGLCTVQKLLIIKTFV